MYPFQTYQGTAEDLNRAEAPAAWIGRRLRNTAANEIIRTALLHKSFRDGIVNGVITSSNVIERMREFATDEQMKAVLFSRTDAMLRFRL